MNTHKSESVSQILDTKLMQDFIKYLDVKDKGSIKIIFSIVARGRSKNFIHKLSVAGMLVEFSFFLFETRRDALEKIRNMDYIPFEDLLKQGLIGLDLESINTYLYAERKNIQ